MKKLAMACVALMALLGAQVARALTVPRVLTFTAYVTDSSGTAETGRHGFTFAMYDKAEDGALLWSESQNDVMVSEGQVSVTLGSVNAFSDSAFEGGSVYLQVSFDGAVLSPSMPLTAVPYALVAQEAVRSLEADHAVSADSATRATSATSTALLAAGAVARGDLTVNGTLNSPNGVFQDVTIGTASVVIYTKNLACGGKANVMTLEAQCAWGATYDNVPIGRLLKY